MRGPTPQTPALVSSSFFRGFLSGKPRACPAPPCLSPASLCQLNPIPPFHLSSLCPLSAQWPSGGSSPVSGPSLARGKVQTLPPPSQASRPLLNLHFENFPWTSHLQATAAHPPSFPLPVGCSSHGPSLPISSALFTLGTRTSYSEPSVQLLPLASCSLTGVSISCLFSLELTITQPCSPPRPAPPVPPQKNAS